MILRAVGWESAFPVSPREYASGPRDRYLVQVGKDGGFTRHGPWRGCAFGGGARLPVEEAGLSPEVWETPVVEGRGVEEHALLAPSALETYLRGWLAHDVAPSHWLVCEAGMPSHGAKPLAHEVEQPAQLVYGLEPLAQCRVQPAVSAHSMSLRSPKLPQLARAQSCNRQPGAGWRSVPALPTLAAAEDEAWSIVGAETKPHAEAEGPSEEQALEQEGSTRARGQVAAHSWPPTSAPAVPTSSPRAVHDPAGSPRASGAHAVPPPGAGQPATTRRDAVASATPGEGTVPHPGGAQGTARGSEPPPATQRSCGLQVPEDTTQGRVSLAAAKLNAESLVGTQHALPLTSGLLPQPRHSAAREAHCRQRPSMVLWECLVPKQRMATEQHAQPATGGALPLMSAAMAQRIVVPVADQRTDEPLVPVVTTQQGALPAASHWRPQPQRRELSQPDAPTVELPAATGKVHTAAVRRSTQPVAPVEELAIAQHRVQLTAVLWDVQSEAVAEKLAAAQSRERTTAVQLSVQLEAKRSTAVQHCSQPAAAPLRVPPVASAKELAIAQCSSQPTAAQRDAQPGTDAKESAAAECSKRVGAAQRSAPPVAAKLAATGAIQLRSGHGASLQSAAAVAERALASQHDAQPETSAELRTPSDQGPTVQLKLMVQLELRTKPQARGGQALAIAVPGATSTWRGAEGANLATVGAARRAAGAGRSWHAAAYARRGPNCEYNCYHSHWCTTQPPSQPQVHSENPARLRVWHSTQPVATQPGAKPRVPAGQSATAQCELVELVQSVGP
ncbi:hypothetical protein CYMTET_10459 [Cymbomonas tetramitiformis]|uniref:Uncharacterized protein n=1 Tax=Cymbomonas tetramitiformis TaxID=36881 RepID=A0AAE0GPP4_9CHLO|nr:hypothetical protein CYMTET_10459 [Cymbomonas tetramitiformis]